MRASREFCYFFHTDWFQPRFVRRILHVRPDLSKRPNDRSTNSDRPSVSIREGKWLIFEPGLGAKLSIMRGGPVYSNPSSKWERIIHFAFGAAFLSTRVRLQMSFTSTRDLSENIQWRNTGVFLTAPNAPFPILFTPPRFINWYQPYTGDQRPLRLQG
jgi:hypothetical protein